MVGIHTINPTTTHIQDTMEELLGKLVEYSLVVGILAAIVIFLVKKLNKAEDEIARLNEAAKSEQKEYINKIADALNDNTTVMEKLTDVIKYGNKT